MSWPVELRKEIPRLMVKMSGKQNKAFHLANSGNYRKQIKKPSPKAQTSRKLLLLMLWQLFMCVVCLCVLLCCVWCVVLCVVCCTMHSSHAHEHAHAKALRHHKSTTTSTTITTMWLDGYMAIWIYSATQHHRLK